MAKTIVGLFDNFSEAQEVARDLADRGFSQDQISVIANAENLPREGGTSAKASTSGSEMGKGAATGAVTGGVIGGAAGLLAAAAGLTIPGIGPILAAGPLAAALSGAGIGAVAGGLIGALVKSGVPEDEAQYYAEGVRRGGSLVTVSAGDDMADRAADIMHAHGAVDIDERAGAWRKQGWSGFGEETQPLSRADLDKEREAILPVVEERVKVGKRKVERGGVRVYSHVSEQPVEEDISLHEERAKVERRPVDRPLEAGEGAFKETTIEVRETGEEPVVGKEARVVEEVRVGKQAQERKETIRETERRTDVEVESTGSKSMGGKRMASSSDFDLYGSDFRAHHQKSYGGLGGSYNDYESAYRHGFDLSSSGRLGDRDWDTIEMEARRDWERDHPGTWERFRDAIKYGWSRDRGAHYAGPERRKQPRAESRPGL